MIIETFAAALGALAFALLFGIPKRYFPGCALCGGVGWLIYSIMISFTIVGNAPATLCASIVMAFLSRILAVRQSCPVTIFLTSGIIPLVPGSKLFWMAYYMVMGSNSPAAQYGADSLLAAGAIVLGIVLVFEIPGKFFNLFQKKTN